jgi:Ca2+:H+ antiporter
MRNPLNWLLLLAPVAVALDLSGRGSAIELFFASALAIVPLAALLGRATEQLSLRAGARVGGLLNATFGNAPELIIAITGLRAGLVDMVKSATVGAILANQLLALGLAFLCGGLRHHEQRFDARGVGVQSSVLMIAATAMIVPALFHNFLPGAGLRAERDLNVAIAIVLLVAYALHLVFVLWTHPDFFEQAAETATEGEAWSARTSVAVLLGTSLLIAWLSEALVGAVEGAGRSLGMSEVFIGVVVLSVVSASTESSAAIMMARKNRIDLALGITTGSSIQVALLVLPILVLLSQLVGPRPMDLLITNAGVTIVFLTVLMGAMVANDGSSNWYKGVALIAVYAIIAILCYFLPGAGPSPASG